jgi:MFS family permease
MKIFERYPRQFWLVFAGYIINRTSGGLIWPFMMIFMRQQLSVPLTMVALLLSIQSIAGLVSTSIIGVVMDIFGRKGIIVMGLTGTSLVLVAMHNAYTLEAWAVLIALYGVFIPIFNVGGNAVIADIVDEDRRDGAYALIRMAQNVGVAIGPAIGGFLIVASYGLTYYITAAVNITLAILIIFFLAETLPARKRQESDRKPGGGYIKLLQDRPFLFFCGAFLLLEMVITLIFILLPVYAKENFGIPENQYGFIVTINAAMVVLFQYMVTRVTQRYRRMPVIVIGAAIYALGIFSIALGRSFEAFALSMVIVTTGELIAAPTSLALVAGIAPPDMRARYMGVYGLTWTIASGIAPVIGGILSDNIAPAAIWYGGAVMGLAAAGGFYLLMRSNLMEEKAKMDGEMTIVSANQESL